MKQVFKITQNLSLAVEFVDNTIQQSILAAFALHRWNQDVTQL